MGKFEKLSKSIQAKQDISKDRADAIAATIGRNKYGRKKFAEMAAKGKSK